MGLCFFYATLRLRERGPGGISRQQYFEHILAHLRGVRHEQDRSLNESQSVAYSDPWVGSFREIALKDNYKPLTDTSKWSILLNSCADGDFDVFAATLKSTGPVPIPDPIQPVACLAAQSGHHHLLRYCLTKGAIWDRNLINACERGVKSVEMIELLFAEDWHNIRTSPQAARAQVNIIGGNSPPGNWLRSKVFQSSDGEDERTTNALVPPFASKHPDGSLTAEQIDKWFGDIDW